MKVTMAQLNPTVGHFARNLAKVEYALQSSAVDQPDLLVLSELLLTGYPPRDLLERRWFVSEAEKALLKLQEMSRRYPQTGILAGTAWATNLPARKGLYNSAVLVQDGQVLFRADKSLLPTYDVFDEGRYFAPAQTTAVVRFKDEVLGLSICEDAWNDPELWPDVPYTRDPIAELAAQGATLMINISASPFWAGKDLLRYQLISGHARRHGVPFMFVNQVGGNDELIFDGGSLFLDKQGCPVSIFPRFREYVEIVDTRARATPDTYHPRPQVMDIYAALCLGLHDYLRKTGFQEVVVGLSGGVDSAVTCAVAVAALGPDAVHGVSMPSAYSSQGSVEDARRLAENLGIDYRTVPIQGIFASYLPALKPSFGDRPADVTEENLQARIRGNILMALSNKFGYLVLTTGNKSELAVGYCTLYGDMSGGLGVIADLPKTTVYDLARFINQQRVVIPEATLSKAPSAELRLNQTDQDTLPPYEILDGILRLYVDEGRTAAEIVAQDYDPATVAWVIASVNRAEYKRWQAAPVLKVTSKAFGMGRRMPLAARYSSELQTEKA